MYLTAMMRTSVAGSTKTTTAKAAARTAVAVLGFLIGTGSNAATMVGDRASAYGKPKHIVQAPIRVAVKKDAIDVRSPSQHLENIKSVLNLPVSETASTFGVTRQSIYKWLAGTSAPEPEKFDKLKELSRVADVFKAAGTDRSGELLRMKVFDGKSILDLFKNGEPYAASLPILIQESKAMDAAYKISNIESMQQNRTNDWKSSISIPFSNDV